MSSFRHCHVKPRRSTRNHQRRISCLIARVVQDRGRAEELAVEVFLKRSRNRKAQGENTEGWLY